MKATFVELPPFQRVRDAYLDDTVFKALQRELTKNPEAGDVIGSRVWRSRMHKPRS
jgi:hypothetical protein